MPPRPDGQTRILCASFGGFEMVPVLAACGLCGALIDAHHITSIGIYHNIKKKRAEKHEMRLDTAFFSRDPRIRLTIGHDALCLLRAFHWPLQ